MVAVRGLWSDRKPKAQEGKLTELVKSFHARAKQSDFKSVTGTQVED